MASTNRQRNKPKAERTDSEKVTANWRKTLGLFERGEFSVSIIRAATAAELMTNLAVRHELVTTRDLPPKFVDHLLVWANGVAGKFHKLLLPMLEGTERHTAVSALSKALKRVSDERNKVVHRGEFKKQSTARAALVAAHEYIQGLAATYAPSMHLREPGASILRSRKDARNGDARG